MYIYGSWSRMRSVQKKREKKAPFLTGKPLVRIGERDRVLLTEGLGIHTYLAGETP